MGFKRVRRWGIGAGQEVVGHICSSFSGCAKDGRGVCPSHWEDEREGHQGRLVRDSWEKDSEARDIGRSKVNAIEAVANIQF